MNIRLSEWSLIVKKVHALLGKRASDIRWSDIGYSVVDTGHSAKFTYKVEKSGAIRIDDQSIKFTHGPSGEKSKATSR